MTDDMIGTSAFLLHKSLLFDVLQYVHPNC
jgi:hypothetical protein